MEATGFKDIVRTSIRYDTATHKSMDIVVVIHMDGLMTSWVDVLYVPKGKKTPVHATFGNLDEASKYFDSITPYM